MGIVLEKPAFPAVVDCPLCHQPALYLFDDVVSDGIWAHCEQCKSHGDIITFASRIWNISQAEALNRFVDLGAANQSETDRVSGEYLRTLNRLAAGEAFWEESAHQLWQHRDDVIACRLREIGLDHTIDGCSGLIGVAHPDQIAAFCSSVGRATPPRLREAGPSLVLPYYDLPGRLTGMLLVQYNDDFVSRRTFVPLCGYLKRKADAGYFLLHTVLTPTSDVFRNSYFVFDDPFWALSLQCVNLKSGMGLLPLAAYYSGPEAVSVGLNWQSFAPTPRFFNSKTYTPEVISQAATAKGYVCAKSPSKRVRTTSAPDAVKRLASVRAAAETWQAALKAALQGMNETAACSFVTRMTVSAEKLQQFFAINSVGLSRDFFSRVLTRMEAAPQIPVKIQKKWIIVERDDGWYTHTNSQICNARIQIKKLVHSDAGARVYVGTVLINGRELDFADRADKIERMGLLAFAQQHAAAAGEIVVFDRMWNNRATMAALQLSTPEVVRVSGRYGWNSTTNEFCFYNYSLSNDGKVCPALYPAIREKKHADFPEPVTLAPITLRPLLLPSHDNALFWSVFAVIAADLLAPVLNRATSPTACSAATYDAAAGVGAALDCPQLKVLMAESRFAARHVATAIQAAEWPLFVAHNFNDKTLGSVPIRALQGSGVVKMPEVAGLLAQGYGWRFLRGAVSAPTPDLTPMRYVLPRYIQRCFENRLVQLTAQPDLTIAVLSDLAAWLKDIYGEAFNLSCALNCLTAPDRAHEALMEAVNTGLTAGKLDILPRPRRKDQSSAYLLRNKRHWWLNQKAIDRYCISVASVAPNWPALTAILDKQGLLGGEELVHNMPGLLVNKNWCDQFWTDYAAPAAQNLG